MVSVIIPIYNTENYLERCLESIRIQTYEDMEVIMVDDGSTDSSRSIANSFAEKDNRFRLFIQKNAGVSAARNYGLDIAKGEYILFVDSDDWLESQMVERLVDNMNIYDTEIACCQYDRNKCFDSVTVEVWERDEALQKFLEHRQINGSLVNKLFKREMIDDNRLDKSIRYGEDALFLWKNLLNIDSIVVSADVLYHVTLHDDSASGGGSYKPIRRDCIKVWENIVEDSKNLSKELMQTARAQLGNMAFFSLYEMMYYGYRNEDHQKVYLDVLNNVIKDLRTAKFIPLSEKVIAHFFLCSVNLGRMLVALKKNIHK